MVAAADRQHHRSAVARSVPDLGRIFAASPPAHQAEIGGVLIKGSPSCRTLFTALLAWPTRALSFLFWLILTC